MRWFHLIGRQLKRRSAMRMRMIDSNNFLLLANHNNNNDKTKMGPISIRTERHEPMTGDINFFSMCWKRNSDDFVFAINLTHLNSVERLIEFIV